MFKGLGKRVVSMIVCLAMIVALLPQFAVPAKAAVSVQEITGKTVDPSTLDAWKQYFGANVLSTEYIGGVWTDKSVFADFESYLTAAGITQLQGPSAAITNQVRQMLQTDPANFLVTMSAIAANQQITGYTTKPTDTMFVLDVSQSMDTQRYIPGMIDAANDAIKTLMDGNPNNRVGVVLFSGSNSFGNSGAGTATVLLPLDHYTSSNSTGTFLRYTGSSDTTVYIATNVKNSDGTTMSSNTGKNTVGGTYTQNGLYKAWLEFADLTAADTVIPDGQPQAGAKRTPAMVLMTDGEPTTADTTYYDIGTSNVGDGGDPDNQTANRITFLNQLTAAWIKAKLANKYGVANNEVLFYTVGLNTSTDAFATAVLNPASSNNSTLANWWEDFVEATPDRNGQITLGSGSSRWTGYKTNDGMITSEAQRVYPTQYFSAANTDGLAEAFAKIADTLTQKTPYVTLVSEGNLGDLDGYVTFEDKLGVLMEVKNVKGLVLGNRVFTGAELAKSINEGDLGSTTNPSEYGDEFVRTVKERLGIADTTVAQNLIRNAYQTGQLSYTSATEYSNYIGWYADADGNYLGFWQESDGYGTDVAPDGAAYINKSYGYLGAEAATAGASDMMHVVVMVHTEIATGDQSVIYKIPASLIPTVLYNVTLEGADPTKPESITREEADPLQLLVEVGLRSDINTVNLETKIAEYLENGGHIHENPNGTYTFYTNRWGDGDGGEVDYDLPLTHVVTESHFHPATDNTRYYFTEDTLVYRNASGAVYTGASAPSGEGYYYARSYYEMVGGNARYTTEYVPLTAVNAARAVRGADGWYVPAGTPQQLARFAATKGRNETGTLAYSWNPVVLHDDSGYNSYAFLGNNGSFTLAPAQGIALTKTVAEVSEDQNAPTRFTFTVTLGQAVENPVITDPDGKPLTGVATVEGNKITVTLAADQTVVITGLPTGISYTVEEEATGYYAASSVNATGTVTANTIHAVDFVNTARGFGSLVVSKNVNYPQGFVPGNAHNEKTFPISVTFTGDISAMIAPQGATRDGNTFTLMLKDGQSATFTNILEGVTYTVTEGEVSGGYEFQELRYSDEDRTIDGKDLDQAHVVNRYTLQPVSPNVKIRGDKTLVTNEDNWGGETFTVELLRIDHFADEEPVSTGLTATMTESAPHYEIDLSSIEFTEAGIYYFRAVEVIPADRNENIAYDRTFGLFSVTVGDADADGKLEVQAVNAYQSTFVSGGTDGWVLQKDFTNVVTTDRIYLDIQKHVVDANTQAPVNTHLGDITFGLFTAMRYENIAPSYYALTNTRGEATLMIPVTKEAIQESQDGRIVYFMREIAPAVENRVVGMDYNEDWMYAISITWDEQSNQAIVSYAPITDGQVGAYTVYTEDGFTFEQTNTYESDVSVDIDLTGSKTLNGGSDLGGREFNFSLYESTAAFVQGELIESVRNDGSAISFNDITFTEPGVYYMVAKENASTLGGIAVDTTEYHITVEVEKFSDTDGTTRLRLVQGYPTVIAYGTSENVGTDGLNFNNRYTITGNAEVTISGTKTLDGRELIANEFQFGLYEGQELIASVWNRTNGSFVFPTITYTPADLGIHTYTVKEIVPTEKLGGVTYDDTEFTVVVEVKDNGQGGITATKTQDPAIEFENKYTAEPIDVTLTGTKTLFNEDTRADMPLSGNEFTFNLYRSNRTFSTQGSLVKSVRNGQGGSIRLTLNDLTAGDYYYILREELGEAAGTSYDSSVYNIRVLVTDNGNGTLSASVTISRVGDGENTIAFGNRYIPGPTTAVIAGTKALTGRDLVEGEFTFVLLDENEQELQTTENVGNTFAFDEIFYENTGIYTYKVIERIPVEHENWTYKGVTYDRTIYTVTVTVTDDNGTLKAEVTYPGTGLVFNNSYEGADTHFGVSGRKSYNKTLTAGQFTFELVDKNGVHIATTTNDANGDFSFTNIPLAEVGDYTFFVREKQPDGTVDNKLHGITYDATEYKVTVSVTDPGDGQLVASTPVIEGGEIVFTNSYNVEPIQATIRARKNLEGRNLAADEFTFTLEGEGVSQQVTNRGDGSIVFQPIEYTAAGAYEYIIREEQGNLGGVDYDTTPHSVLVVVTDNGDGTLSADVVYPNGNITFTNTYTVTGDTQFTVGGTKILDGREMTAEDVFTFELKDSTGAVIRTEDAVNGKFLFENVKLDKLGTHTFTVTEKVPAGAVDGVKNGITYSKRAYTVTVEVRDNGQGGMTAGAPVVSYNGVDVAEMTFRNTYQVTEGTKTDILGKKTLSGNKTLTANMFTFELYAGTDTTAEPIATAKNKADGSIEFKDVALSTLGENVFTVVEQAPEGGKLDGITYSTLIYTVVVETTDNGVGGMTAGEPVYYLGQVAQDEMEFINSYAVEGEVPARIEGTKTLEGGKKLSANDFTFELYEGTAATGTPKALAQNAQDGSFGFDLSFNAPGTYTYTVRELAPEGYYADNIRYSELVYQVSIVVEDNGVGGMTVSAPVYTLENAPVDAIEFVNTYEPDEVPFQMVINKIVKINSGNGVSPEGFKFQIWHEGVVIEELTSNAEGTVKMDMVVTAEDIGMVAELKVTELNTGVRGVTYSTVEHVINIAVGQNDDGTIRLDLMLNGEAVDALEMEFVNTYDKSSTPNTGDDFSISLFVGLMATSAIGMAALLLAKKKKMIAE